MIIIIIIIIITIIILQNFGFAFSVFRKKLIITKTKKDL